ncbi:MAG: TetR family transcriptional regulator [Myxococcales bacterium]|nr:TetR family transcriptional regulator [Myxococcales bacterium]MCB9754129.1 TetR family transcriptional regulator [Myxococcales bacterium]
MANGRNRDHRSESLASLRDRKLRMTRTHLAELALTLLLERGFDEVTVDELAEAAGISRRTFFRYFPSKEDVVIGTFDEPGDALLHELARRLEREPPLLALRSTLEAIIETFGTDLARAQATLHMIRHTPTLRGRFLVTQDDWTRRLATLLRARPPRRNPMIAELTARVAIAAIDTALVAWGERPQEDLRSIAKQVFDALGEVARDRE